MGEQGMKRHDGIPDLIKLVGSPLLIVRGSSGLSFHEIFSNVSHLSPRFIRPGTKQGDSSLYVFLVLSRNRMGRRVFRIFFLRPQFRIDLVF